MAGRGRCLLRLLVGAVLLAPLLSMGGSTSGAATTPSVASLAAGVDPSGLEALLLQLLNGERARSGLPVVGADGSMAAMARSHSKAMASEDRIFHDPAKAVLIGRCVSVGENVGRATAVDIVHQAFMASAFHRSAILGSYDRVGVGVAAGPTMIYVTELFCQSSPAQPQPAPHPSPEPPKPAPETPKPAPRPVKPAPAPSVSLPGPAPAPTVMLGKPSGMGTPCRLV